MLNRLFEKYKKIFHNESKQISIKTKVRKQKPKQIIYYEVILTKENKK